MGPADAEGFDDKARAYLSRQMQAELKEKQETRFPNVIVPGAVKPINVTDKDGNGVYRLVAYKD